MLDGMKQELIQLLKTLEEKLDKLSSNINLKWEGILKLIITLSSTFLIGTAAIVDKLFTDISYILIFAWSYSLLSISFGILMLIDDVIFYGNLLEKIQIKIQRCLGAISSMKEDDIKKAFTNDEKVLERNSIFFGVICIFSFLLSIIQYFLSFLDVYITETLFWTILGVCYSIIFWITYYLINKRNKYINSGNKK